MGTIIWRENIKCQTMAGGAIFGTDRRGSCSAYLPALDGDAVPHAEVADQVSGGTVARRRYGVLVAVVDHVCAAYVDPLLLPVGVAAEGAGCRQPWLCAAPG